MNSNIIKPTLVILVALLLLPYLSQAQDHGISGTWYNGNTQTHINARFGNTVRLDNGEGSTATGFFTNPWTIKSTTMERNRRYKAKRKQNRLV